jgi:4-hydroxy-3-methylbut-2-enyl diphosphate reductase
MKIYLAKPRGFCAGVVMAIETLERALELLGPPLYVYHEIVHNKHVVEKFRQRGVIFVNSLDEVPDGANVLFSAHGVSPDVRRTAQQRGLFAIDATCPLVTKVHLEACRFAREGYTIVLIGHAGHDEVVGTMGEAPDQMVLVETIDHVETLQVPNPDKVAYLTQTTLSVDDANRIIEALRRRFPKIQGPPKEDICYATQNRQEAVKYLAPQVDLVLVVGSQNSSNSIRLTEVAQEQGTPALLIDGPQELRPDLFTGVERVALTAGASAPEELVQEVIQWLQRQFGADVEEVCLREEEVYFPLPRVLRDWDGSRGPALPQVAD